jgi:hypothetical protein
MQPKESLTVDARPSPFPNGAKWVRADFHLHTKADREFDYPGEAKPTYRLRSTLWLEDPSLQKALLSGKRTISELRQEHDKTTGSSGPG